MNDKLIFRAAVAYHKMLTNMAAANISDINFSRHICNIKNIMAEISVWYGRLEIAQTKGWKSATSFLKQTMIKRLVQNAANNFSVMETELLEENEISVPTIKELWQEIKSLNGLFENCEFKNNRLSVETAPIVLEHHGEEFKFGKFKITIDFKTDIVARSYEHMVYMEALEPNHATAEESLVHPHVRDDKPCLGDAVGLMQKPFVQGNIESVFLVLNSMLKTYNPGSPYRTLEDWYDEECSCPVCDREVDEDELYCCEDCGSSICNECYNFCHRCENYYCENCMGFTCGWCKESVCNGCDHATCNGCNMTLCENCVCGCCESYCEECSPICESCSNSFCPGCEGVECAVCNKKYCENCALSCEECGAETCSDCGNECAKCEDVICPECTRNCGNCNKNYCKNCIDEEECSLLKEKV